MLPRTRNAAAGQGVFVQLPCRLNLAQRIQVTASPVTAPASLSAFVACQQGNEVAASYDEMEADDEDGEHPADDAAFGESGRQDG